VIANHHGDFDARTGGTQLIKNSLMRRYDVIKFLYTLNKGQFPKPECIATISNSVSGPSCSSFFRNAMNSGA
jgi:hypothetical protein